MGSSDVDEGAGGGHGGGVMVDDPHQFSHQIGDIGISRETIHQNDLVLFMEMQILRRDQGNPQFLYGYLEGFTLEFPVVA
jgi:hypothetical protein